VTNRVIHKDDSLISQRAIEGCCNRKDEEQPECDGFHALSLDQETGIEHDAARYLSYYRLLRSYSPHHRRVFPVPRLMPVSQILVVHYLRRLPVPLTWSPSYTTVYSPTNELSQKYPAFLALRPGRAHKRSRDHNIRNNIF
jgi:hypothetical protein